MGKPMTFSYEKLYLYQFGLSNSKKKKSPMLSSIWIQLLNASDLSVRSHVCCHLHTVTCKNYKTLKLVKTITRADNNSPTENLYKLAMQQNI